MFPVTCQAVSFFLENQFLLGGGDTAARTVPTAVK